MPGRDSMAISIRPSHFIPTQAYASISWDDGKEVCLLRHRELESFSNEIAQIRLYYLGPGNVLHEYAHSVSKGKNSWYYGDLEIVLSPTSNIAAIRLEDDDDTICIYYQGQ